MLDFIKELPFSIEAWKVSTLLLTVLVGYLSTVYNDYHKLRTKTDGKIYDLHEMVKDINENIEEILEKVEHTNEKMVYIRVQYEKISLTIDKFIKVITTTDEIGEKQKEQLELLNKIMQHFQTSDVCDLKESINVEGKEDDLNLKKLLDMMCDEYELHRKD